MVSLLQQMSWQLEMTAELNRQLETGATDMDAIINVAAQLVDKTKAKMQATYDQRSILYHLWHVLRKLLTLQTNISYIKFMIIT